MRRTKTELLPPPALVRQAEIYLPSQEATLEKLVQQKVAEALLRHEEFVTFEPFFRSRRVAYEMKRLQTVSEQKKWSIRYLRFGCLHCGGTNRLHGGCGCCDRCYQKVSNENKAIILEMDTELR